MRTLCVVLALLLTALVRRAEAQSIRASAMVVQPAGSVRIATDSVSQRPGSEGVQRIGIRSGERLEIRTGEGAVLRATEKPREVHITIDYVGS